MSKAAVWLGAKRTGLETRLRWMLARPRGPLAPGRAEVSPRSGEGSIILSEWLVLTGLALAVLWTRLSKFVPLERISITAHFPGSVLVAGVLLTVIGSLLFRTRAVVWAADCPPVRVLWPLLLLSAFILAGSSYLLYVDKEPNTFRIAGAYMLVAYMVAQVVAASRSPVRLVMSYFVLLCVAAVPTVVAMCYFFSAGIANLAPFHELEFFVIPLAVFWVVRSPKPSIFAIASFWIAIACALVFRKNTAYLVALGVVVYVWLFHWRVSVNRKTALRTSLGMLIGSLLVIGAGGTYLYLRQNAVDFVPSGNAEFRIATYGIAWQRFLDSPVWGAAYLKPAAEKFEAYDTGVAGNILVTHSDLLDLLAHGGLIAATLWAIAHYLLFRAAYRYILSRRGELPANVVGVTHTLCCMILLGILTYAFNPLWLNPTRALLVWANLGLLAGLVAVYSRRPELTSSVDDKLR